MTRIRHCNMASLQCASTSKNVFCFFFSSVHHDPGNYLLIGTNYKANHDDNSDNIVVALTDLITSREALLTGLTIGVVLGTVASHLSGVSHLAAAQIWSRLPWGIVITFGAVQVTSKVVEVSPTVPQQFMRYRLLPQYFVSDGIPRLPFRWTADGTKKFS